MRHVALFVLFAVVGGPIVGAQGVAESLRAPTKIFTVKDLPVGYRAVSLNPGSGGLTSAMLFGAFSPRNEGSSEPEAAILLSLLDATFVDPEEFEALLDGKRPRIRGYTLDLPAMTRATTPRNGTPTPIFTESWIEAGKIVQWSPKTDLTPESLLKLYGNRDDEASPQSASDKTMTLNRAKQVAVAAILYSGDNDDVFPKAESTAQAQAALAPYLRSEDSFKSLNPSGGRLLYNTHLSGLNTARLSPSAETILVWDERAWPDGSRIVAYLDGRGEVLSRLQWDKTWNSELRRREETRKRKPR